MKLIVAIIRPERINDVLKQLFMSEVYGLTISDAKGHGGERAQVETYRGTTVRMELTDKVRIEIAVSEEFVDPTVQAIITAAHTGEVGDGKVFVMPLEASYRIRTGERDQAAVTPIR
ncbi:MAG: P-II family nitrogen regulator [Sphaerobacteraceae bacterium]|nr:MAG: P-II family nitrogen regulator [Sphaerobacteraceae bacterium]